MRNPLLLVVLFVVVVLCAACGVGGEDGSPAINEEAEGDDPASEADLTGSGSSTRWTPPKVLADGTYSGGAPWNGGKGCTGGMLPGTKSIKSLVEREFKVKVAGYACRQNTAKKSQVSMHGTGRALDIFTSGSGGVKIADWLVNNHKSLGIQLVIYSRAKWNAAMGAGPYSGPNPHTDHIHAELTEAAADDASIGDKLDDKSDNGGSGLPEAESGDDGSDNEEGEDDGGDRGDGTDCWSATLERRLAALACVQSRFDQLWFQCKGGEWYRGVEGNEGPYGLCSERHPL